MQIVVAFFYNDKAVLFEPKFEVFNDFATDLFVLDDTLPELVRFGFELGF